MQALRCHPVGPLLLGALFSCLAAVPVPVNAAEPSTKVFRAGAHAADVNPPQFPVVVNAMFTERNADKVADPLHARCLVLDDGQVRLAIAVVDTCMMPRDLIDAAKEQASRATGIPTDRMLISATHTHSAPSAMGCLGSRVDPDYAKFLPGRIAAGIEQAFKNLQPARIGWAVVPDWEHTFNRRWIRRPDRVGEDPFGKATVRANMHPGHQSPDVVGPSGPVDPELSVVSVQTRDGRPLALLANYSMHYYGSPLLSADYYGRFAGKIARLLGATNASPPFVGIMSQGTSGDLMWMDYGAPRREIGYDAYAEAIAQKVFQACRTIRHHDWVPLAMRETKLTLNFRVPDAARLAWARQTVAGLDGRLPKALPEIYAQEAIYLDERPTAELKLQALRIGELGIAAIPNEVFALTGLKLKAHSPLQPTFTIELANGAEGYIPPPEQHKLGGYTTWPARTAGLEVEAEPKIVEAVVRLLEEVSGQPRRQPAEPAGAYPQAVLESKPRAYWRFGEFSGPQARDASAHGATATFEDGVVFYLPGPDAPAFSSNQINRAAHFAGGRARAALPTLGGTYSVEFWFWNGLKHDLRPVTGYLVSRGPAGDREAAGDHLGIGGTHTAGGRLLFFNGNRRNQVLAGRTEIETKTWNHVVLVREGAKVRVHLNGNFLPDLEGEAEPTAPGAADLFVGGRNDNFANFEGKLDEVAVYDRALKPDEIVAHFKASGLPPKPNQPRLSPAPPKSPAESLKALHVTPGFEIELVAAEPLTQDPVAIDWDTQGRLWVVEMADYPYGMDGRMKPGGRVRVLADTDGDGRYDRSTLFLDGLNFPNGILTWRRGAIITAAPEIFYAEDTDGDGRADLRNTLFTGFKEGNLQLRINGLRWGLDNWIYCANGWSGGRALAPRTGQKFDLSGRDVRLKPDEGWIDLQSGVSQFGRNRNDWDDWFGVDNSHPLFYYPLPDHYARRNPHVPAVDPKIQVIVPANPKVFPVSRPEKRYHSFEQAGRFTSACSAMIYRDEFLFGADSDAHVFVCEPFHNLVHHEVMTERGVGFTAHRASDEPASDFLASEDNWFRPVMVRTGPDGALWVVDMYRFMIEHPDWLPPEGKAELEPFYRHGEDRGRIYRVFAQGSRPRPVPNLEKLTGAELVGQLEHPNGWVRDKVHQLLLWRGDRAIVPLLEQQAAQGGNAQARLHALCVLDGLNALEPPALERALRDEHPGVRRHAVRLAETRAAAFPTLVSAACRLADDPDLKVRLQLACSLGEWSTPAAGEALARLALANYRDPHLTAAVLSSATNHVAALAQAVAKLPAAAEARAVLAEPLLMTALAMNRRDAVSALLANLLAPEAGAFTAEQMRGYGRFADLLARRKTSAETLAAAHADALADQLGRSAALFAQARRVLADAGRTEDLRAAAAALLGREAGRQQEDFQLLAGLLSPQTPPSVQRAAVRSIAGIGDASAPGLLLRDWTAFGPDLRAAILDELLAREPWAFELLKRLEAGSVGAQELDAARRERLLKHGSERVRKLARALFQTASNRREVVEQFRPALALKGNPRHGAEIFTARCASCHKLEGAGREIGPDLRSVTDRSPEGLLASILDPSSAVEPRYLAYSAALTNGEEVYGLIASETGTTVTLKLADDSTRSLLRSELAALRSTRLSLMPEGLEAGLSLQDLADLIEYVRSEPGRETHTAR